MPDQELVKRSQRTEAKLNGSTAQLAASEKSQVTPEVIALQLLPNRRGLPFPLVPTTELHDRLPVIPLRVGRGAPVRREVLEELATVAIQRR
jgi:hypothetical protein